MTASQQLRTIGQSVSRVVDRYWSNLPKFKVRLNLRDPEEQNQGS
jgi:hypothetical protein